MSKKDLETFAAEVTTDEEQELWETKKLGKDPKHAKRSTFYKAPSKLISIRVPEEVLEEKKDSLIAKNDFN